MLLPRINNLEPLALARPLAVLFGAIVVAWAGLVWGPSGTLAAGIGSLLSIGNVWFLARVGARAMREAGAEPSAVTGTYAASRLHLALGAKTIILLALVAVLSQQGWASLAMTPFALGLLVTVFALIAAGLVARGA
ncbi:MAG TPA: hypothetical protein VGG33_08900 [Polyangia bacterium]